MPDLRKALAEFLRPVIEQQTNLLHQLHTTRTLIMASKDTINQALDQLQGTIDTTQENVQALLDLIRSQPDDATLAEIEARLVGMNQDLEGTSFDTTIQPVDDGSGSGTGTTGG